MANKALRDYQIEDLAAYLNHKKILNLSDPGTGKTPSCCALAWFVWSEQGKKTVWPQPTSLMEKNRDELIEFTDFSPDDIEIMASDHAPMVKGWTGPTITRQKKTRGFAVHPKTGERILDEDGKPVRTIELVDEAAIDLIAASTAKVFICSFAFLRQHWKRLFQHHDINCVLVDELHLGYLSNDSAQTKALYHATKRSEYFVGMTGTLIDGRLDSAYPSISIIEPRYYGSHRSFMDHHAAFEDDYGRTLIWKNEDRLTEIISRHSIQRTFESVYGEEPVVLLPPQMIPMGPLMREAYDEFHEASLLELEDGRILDGSIEGVATIRARQIMAHPETFGLCQGERTGKDERLEIHAVENLRRHEPFIIYAVLQPEQERIHKLLGELGVRTGLINGNVPPKRRSEIDRAFRAGDLDAVVASPQTAAVGFNWEHADHVIFVSIDYKDVNILQAWRRASRGTRTKPLRVDFLQYQKSIDQRMAQIIQIKSTLANKVDPNRPILKIAA